MSRTVTGAVATAIATSHVLAAHLVEIQFGSGTVRVTDLPYDITWASNVYSGLGRMGSIEAIRESAQSEATGLRFTIAGPIAAYMSLALGEHVQGDPVLLYVAFFDANHQIIADPVLEWQGRADQLIVVDQPEQASITVAAESRFADFARPRVRRFSDADQQAAYAGDKFFEFVTQMDKTLVWPSRDFFKQ